MKTECREYEMFAAITYYYENAQGVFALVRNIKVITMEDIENAVSDMRVVIKSSGDRPLTHNVIFK